MSGEHLNKKFDKGPIFPSHFTHSTLALNAELKTIFESICGLWGQAALKEKEVILGEDASEGSGTAEGSRQSSPPVLIFRQERLPFSPHFATAPQPNTTPHPDPEEEEEEASDVIPLMQRKRVRKTQAFVVVRSTGGMKDQGVQNSIAEPVGKYITLCHSLRKVSPA
ncbi:hypothetical protein Droror1_Dr00027360 [Drosera rotundifolia]